MYPKQHAVISGLASLGVGLGTVSPLEAIVWAFLGAVAGVVIDVDHALLAMLLKGRWREGLYWFRHPVQAVTQPDSFLEDMAYETLVYHRMLSHLVVIGVLFLFLPFHALALPILAGLVAHVAADVVWEVDTRSYGFLN